MIERRITLFPVPEPPKSPRISPRCRSKDTPRCTFFSPKALCRSWMERATSGVMSGRAASSVFWIHGQDEELGHEEIADHDEDARSDHHPGRRSAYAARPARGVEAFPAGRHRDEERDDDRLG